MSTKPNRKIEVGDEVAYSANFLRSTGQQASKDDVGGWRGRVTGVEGTSGWRLMNVRWSDRSGRPIGYRKVLDLNLAVVGTRAMVAD